MDEQARRVILGERIFSLRKKQGWTQKELAEAIGAHVSYISRWENAAMDMDVSTLNKIADSFKVSVSYLLGEDSTASTTAEIGRLIKSKREMKKINLYDLAMKLKGTIEPLRLNEIEEGISTPTETELASIAEALDISYDALLRDDDNHLGIIKKHLYLMGLSNNEIEPIEHHIKYIIQRK